MKMVLVIIYSMFFVLLMFDFGVVCEFSLTLDFLLFSVDLVHDLKLSSDYFMDPGMKLPDYRLRVFMMG